ncbi:GDSL-like Lipase/Acylhydrolase family protein [Mucilaginibacter gossypiicola]|uniref:GDSL-like Lipase/Acylhydrolase family protein n=1 Tax=Mucilaginibacter gossypiicola TaxID=551995 RepID=A0A1H8BNR5_9SPHI|nr:SGNH/GDSL hydrolase family protein [Mucilaginibacter gossypiicola]SEM84426.1 GDSL-like Lipase/Acylhydrolase family protein [Mucilaginibacter gossypiicola]
MQNRIFDIKWLTVMLLLNVNNVSAQQKPGDKNTASEAWVKYIDLNTYSKPFWKTDTIVDETVQVIRQGDTASAPLLFKAKKILSVKATNYSKTFQQGKDWDYKNGRLIFGINSTVPFFTKDSLVFNKPKPGNSFSGKAQGTYILFAEGSYFASKQISVTYIKDRGEKWKGPVPQYSASKLPNTGMLLNARKKIKIVFYGNSIETGSNASGYEGAPPYMPSWPDQVIYNLRRHYGNNVGYANTSVPGKLAEWGLDSVQTRVVAENPDLVIIGFGMNDGTAKISPDVYRNQIKGIIDAVRVKKPRAEFILIAPILANPLSVFSGLQSSYKAELDKLAVNGIVIADMTGVHSTLLRYKSYQDMTGNNINHPNDYLVRWYAQFICGLLIK